MMLIRHDTSAYNMLKEQKVDDPLYKEFLVAWDRDKGALMTKWLAEQVVEKFSLVVGDADTPLADAEGKQARATGGALSWLSMETPDVIFVSPYKRAWLTLKHLKRGWPALRKIKIVEDDRLREQEHGLALLYNDWRVFHALHPKQRLLYELEGPYDYCYPQGENIPRVRDRQRSIMSTIIRDYAEQDVLVVTHHKSILSIRANLERLNKRQFIRLDERDKPINCGVTRYLGYPNEGKDGKLRLEFYNKKFY